MIILKYSVATSLASLTAAMLLAGSANAAAPSTLTNVFGGGAALVAEELWQAADCYGNETDLYIATGNPLGSTTPVVDNPAPFNYTGAAAQDCSTAHFETSGKSSLNYLSENSGNGIKSIYAHDITRLGVTPSAWASPTVQFSFSETALDANDVSIYNAGGSGGHVGLTVVAPGVTPGAGQIANPSQYYGALVQVPAIIAPVAIVYDPVYKKVYNSGTVTEYKLNIHTPRADGSGGLKLNVATLCQVFNGQIVDWNDPALKKLNGGVSFEDPSDPTPAKSWSVPLQIVGRSDSAGATNVFSRHLAAVCGGVTYTGGVTNQYPDAASTLPSTLIGATYVKGSGSNPPPSGETVGKFTVANGADGVAEYVAFTRTPDTNTTSITQGRIGYTGVDLALPAVLSTGANTYGLNTATLQNHNNQWVAPTAAGALAAFASQLPPQSDADGTYDASVTTNGLRANPQDWVQPNLKSSYIADPVAPRSYPITGTANALVYSCYSTANRFKVVDGFMIWFYSNNLIAAKNTGLLNSAGSSPLPANWRKAVLQTFFNSALASLNLRINQKGQGACTAGSITGG
ncbi:MAG TPA: substrate-binding domain-containing protein [Rhizomicrobium sp.]|jgi:phosphate transport system substrate-binding protein|nr:substrate-binding domain-containing protein [Rhizomicrobium sp.]